MNVPNTTKSAVTNGGIADMGGRVIRAFQQIWAAIQQTLSPAKGII